MARAIGPHRLGSGFWSSRAIRESRARRAPHPSGLTRPIIGPASGPWPCRERSNQRSTVTSDPRKPQHYLWATTPRSGGKSPTSNRETEFFRLRLAGEFRSRTRENGWNSVRRPRCASLTDRNHDGFCRRGNRVGLLGLDGGGCRDRTDGHRNLASLQNEAARRGFSARNDLTQRMSKPLAGRICDANPPRSCAPRQTPGTLRCRNRPRLRADLGLCGPGECCARSIRGSDQPLLDGLRFILAHGASQCDWPPRSADRDGVAVTQ